MRYLHLLIISLAALGAGACAAAKPTFRISIDPAAASAPQSGRLVIYLIAHDARIEPGSAPADGPFWDDPQPMLGRQVANLAPGASIDIIDPDERFPSGRPLPPGRYRAQAVLDVRSTHSNWKHEAGNLYSSPVEFDLAHGESPVIEIRLSNVTVPRALPEIDNLELFEVRSSLLSQFHGYDVFLRAGIVRPFNRDAARQYPAIYEVPGFGGDHYRAVDAVRRRADDGPASPAMVLGADAFWIVLDPESANGHTLFADSANNGPRGRALVTELIPALEKHFNLIPQASARLLRGHSSGGWSVIWLAITYPDTFGAAWSTAPDPVDFRRFQLVNIYQDDNMYWRGGEEIPSYRDQDAVKMTIRQENQMEQVLGPGLSSGQQWASWQAVFGPRREDGRPAPLYDAASGRIDAEVAERYRDFDIAGHVRARPDAAMIFRQRIRLVIGDQDNYYLDQAVALLQSDLESIQFVHFPEGEHGYIKMIPGYDHSSIKDHQSVRGITTEMLDHLLRHGHRTGETR